MQNSFRWKGEEGHDPAKYVDGLTFDYYSKLNVLVSILRSNVFQYLRKGSKISSFLVPLEI